MHGIDHEPHPADVNEHSSLTIEGKAFPEHPIALPNTTQELHWRLSQSMFEKATLGCRQVRNENVVKTLMLMSSPALDDLPRIVV